MHDIELETYAIASSVKGFRCPSVIVDDDGAKLLALCADLEALECNLQSLTDSGASEFKFPAMSLLWFYAPMVTDRGMTWLSDCTHPILVRLDGTGISSRTVELLHPLYIDTLGLSGTAVGDEVLRPISAMSSLRALYLADTKLTDSASTTWDNLTCRATLKVIDLGNTEVGDETAKVLATFPSLEEIRLSDTKVTDVGVMALEGAGVDVITGF